MKKTKWYRVLVLSVLFCSAERVSGQFVYSSIGEYTSVSGNGALVRVDHTNNFHVTSQNSEHNCSRFVVDDGETVRYFSTTTYVSNPMMSPMLPLNSGYIVNAMEIVGTKCWFAGTHWWETGEILFAFGPGGAPYMEIEHCGFIGQFDVADVIAGSGSYKTIDIPDIYEISRMVAHTAGVAAVGMTESGESRVVELLELGTGQWSYDVGKSENSEEVFMDVTNAGGKIVTLSRYKNPVHVMYYKYMFGLRYAPLGGIASSQSQYVYDTYDAFSDPRAAFVGVDPIYVNHTKRGDEILVSYLGKWNNPSNSLEGELIFYRIPVAGGVVAEVLSGVNNVKCTELKEVRLDNALSQYANIALLAEDVYGNSVLRFPYLYGNGIRYDTAYYVSSPVVESLCPFSSTNIGFDVAAVGRHAATFSKLVTIREYSIHSRLDYENLHDCFQTRIGRFHSRYASVFSPQVLNKSVVKIQSARRLPTLKSFRSSLAVKKKKCENGNEIQ